MRPFSHRVRSRARRGRPRASPEGFVTEGDLEFGALSAELLDCDVEAGHLETLASTIVHEVVPGDEL